MYRDPIVEELRQTAAKLIEECGGDLHQVALRLRQEQSRHPHRVVRRQTAIDRKRRPNSDQAE
jgi:hypothetical protein